MEGEKVYTKCKLSKPVGEFYPRSGRPPGQFQSRCKRCEIKRAAARQKGLGAAYRDYMREYMRGYRERRRAGA